MTTGAYLALALILGPQAEDELKRGQAYLEKVAAEWEKKLPVECVLGVYAGRRWAGLAKLSIARAPEGSGAAFEIVMRAELKTEGFEAAVDAQGLFAKNLRFVRVESTEVQNGVKTTRRVEAVGAEWVARVESRERRGALRTGSTWDGLARFLPAFAAPADAVGVVMVTPGEDGDTVWDFSRPAGKRAAAIGGREDEYSAIELRSGGALASVYLLGENGGLAEIRPATSPLRFRPVSKEAVGRDLEERLVVREPERVVLDFYRAVKRNDRGAVLAAFDLARYAEGIDPDYASRSEEKRRALQDEVRASIVESFLGERIRAGLPAEERMEDVLGPKLSSELPAADSAEVTLFSLRFKLARPPEGRWRIHAIEIRR